IDLSFDRSFPVIQHHVVIPLLLDRHREAQFGFELAPEERMGDPGELFLVERIEETNGERSVRFHRQGDQDILRNVLQANRLPLTRWDLDRKTLWIGCGGHVERTQSHHQDETYGEEEVVHLTLCGCGAECHAL